MNNEHNAIAMRINKIQNIWNESLNNDKPVKLIFMEYHADDIFFIHSFLKLEGSEHGKTKDALVSFINSFNDPKFYTYEILEQWILGYQKELEKQPNLPWTEFTVFKERFETLDKKNIEDVDNFFKEIIRSFQKAFPVKARMIVGLFPMQINNKKEFCKWIQEKLNVLDIDFSICIGADNLKDFSSILKAIPNYVHLKIPFLNLREAQKDIATQGNPADPQVGFRKCMFEMGEAAQKNNIKDVIFWGEKMLDITQATGKKSFWASAYLVYAGFLFQFKESVKVHQLLDKGILIAKQDYKTDQELAQILIQLHAYKGSYYSVCNEKENAIEWFIKQAELAKELKINDQVITAYNYAIMLMQKNQDEKFHKVIADAFKFGYVLEDEFLKISNFSFIAFFYLKNFEHQKSKISKKEIEDRMEQIFGKNWRDHIKKAEELVHQ